MFLKPFKNNRVKNILQAKTHNRNRMDLQAPAFLDFPLKNIRNAVVDLNVGGGIGVPVSGFGCVKSIQM